MRRRSSDTESGPSEPMRDRLLRRYFRDRRPADLERLVVSYRPLARSLARRYATASCAREDLDQAASEGLIKAIQRFDPRRGTAFTSFAVPTILGELRRHVRDTAWPAHVPRPLQERVREVRAAAQEFSAAHGRAATVPELALVLDRDEEMVVEALGVSSSLSVLPLDGPGRQDEDAALTVADQLGVEDDGYERVECLTVIEDALPALTASQKATLRLHFGEDLTQRQIAGRLGISRSRVARDLTSAVARLRAATRDVRTAA